MIKLNLQLIYLICNILILASGIIGITFLTNRIIQRLNIFYKKMSTFFIVVEKNCMVIDKNLYTILQYSAKIIDQQEKFLNIDIEKNIFESEYTELKEFPINNNRIGGKINV